MVEKKRTKEKKKLMASRGEEKKHETERGKGGILVRHLLTSTDRGAHHVPLDVVGYKFVPQICGSLLKTTLALPIIDSHLLGTSSCQHHYTYERDGGKHRTCLLRIYLSAPLFSSRPPLRSYCTFFEITTVKGLIRS